MAAFTNEQINEILGIFTQHMGTRQYIGARYVPIFGRKGEASIEWDNSAPYEPLTVVLYQGNSFISRQYVPSGIEITNGEFWANTGNYNAQIEQYRQAVELLTKKYEDIEAIINKIEVIQNYDEIEKTTSKYVYVINNTSSYGDGASLLYEETTATLDTISRENGTYLYPSPKNYIETPTSAPISELADCAASYVAKTNLSYGADTTLFSPNTETQINCSSFVEACMLGITYDNSRYARGSINTNLLGKYATDDMNKNAGAFGYLTTWKLADWFLQNKKFYEINNGNDIYKLAPGDILFGSSNLPEFNNRIYGIDHCMLVVQVFPEDGTILLAQGGGTPQNVTLSNFHGTVCKLTLANFVNNAQSYFVGFARPSYGIGQVNGNNITSYLFSNGTVTLSPGSGDTQIASIQIKKQIKAHKMYYLVCTGKLPIYATEGTWLALRSTPISANIARVYHVSLYNGVCIFPFSPSIDVPLDNLSLRVITENLESTQQYRVDTCAIYEGYCPFNIGYTPLDITRNEEVDFYIFRNFSYFDENGEPHYYFDIELNTGTTLAPNTDLKLGNVNNMTQIGNSYYTAFIGNTRTIPARFENSDNSFHIFNITDITLTKGNVIRIRS